MLSTKAIQTLARYNQWQNQSLYGAADLLDDAARRADRGAFFRSIHETLSHVYWGDSIWMSRLAGWEKPSAPFSDSASFVRDWAELRARRADADARIIAWADALTEADIAGDLVWISGVAKAELTRPRWQILLHFFNHQTHHRGQVHAMLTAAGAKPDDTDLMLMKL